MGVHDQANQWRGAAEKAETAAARIRETEGLRASESENDLAHGFKGSAAGDQRSVNLLPGAEQIPAVR